MRGVVRLALAATLLAGPCGPALAGSFEVEGLRLGMALPDGEIEAVYENILAGRASDSVGLSFPYDRIETSLTDGSRLSLHFSASVDGARLFWVRHATSWRWPVERAAPAIGEVLGDIERRFGTPSRSLGPRDGSGDLLLVFARPGSSADLPAILELSPDDVGGVQFLSFRQRVALFGIQFDGAVVSIVTDKGEVAAVIEELADHQRGLTVLAAGK